MNKMSQTPQVVADPPPGRMTNLVDPESKVYLASISCAVCVVISVIAFGLRMYTRARLARRFGADDILLCIAYLFVLANTAGMRYQVQVLGGKHAWNTLVSEYYPAVPRLSLINSIIYWAGMCFIKLSLLYLYRRIFGKTGSPCWKICWWTLFVIVVGYSICGSLAKLFSCIPISKAWEFSPDTTNCINLPALWVTTGVMHIVTDIAILVLPIPIVLRTRMNVRQKITVLVLFGTGFFTCATSIVRLWKLMGLLKPHDLTRQFLATTIWTIAEEHMSIVCVSVIALAPFVNRCLTYFGFKQSSSKDIRHEPVNTNSCSGLAQVYASWGTNPSTFHSSTTVRKPQRGDIEACLAKETSLNDAHSRWYQRESEIYGKTVVGCEGPSPGSAERIASAEIERDTAPGTPTTIQAKTTIQVSYDNKARQPVRPRSQTFG
ncbi:hypothetical protein BT63DRAFT_202358 [Microthyrium microscopicum]|uniref:Rhodopsin domain-containing protein n=1 Tax=Microthyrium microscopicum TaxID=703497 RepID=A0A6A6UIC1_9PEZI|nr:hypothetical protein BT63DRAFT_202358 [Microthyrium microscopicum]